MRVIGLVGGIASGKSLVARQFSELGGVVLDADGAGHEVLELPEVRDALGARWGLDIFDSEGRVDRRAVARKVFDPQDVDRIELHFLEEITHPLIRDRLQARIDSVRKHGACLAVILDAPLMLEAGWDRFCQEILFVEAPRAERLRRAIESRGWTEAQFEAREAAQWPVEQKRKRATQVIDNSGDPQAVHPQVEAFWQQHVLMGDSEIGSPESV